MLRFQLLLATLSITATTVLAAIASFHLFVALGLGAAAAAAATAVIVVSRGMELFVDVSVPHPQPLLPWILATWQWLALTAWFMPGEAAGPAGLVESVELLAIPALAALALELGQRLATRLISPSLQHALRADLAVAEWFARRRIDVERELLAELSRDAATDVRFTRRLESLCRRFDRSFPTHA